MLEEDRVDVLYSGKFLSLVKEGKWEYVERVNVDGAVMIIAVTPEEELVLIEEFRVPLHAWTIGFPAGIAGDMGEESNVASAQRELEEEAGYTAKRWQFLCLGPSSPGLTTEMVSFYLAKDLTQVGTGGGVDAENIIVHKIPLPEVHTWIFAQLTAGKIVDPKVFMGLYFLGVPCPR